MKNCEIAFERGGSLELFDAGYIPGRVGKIYFLSDAHIGCENFDETTFCQLIDEIKNDDNAKAILPGDTLHNDLVNSVGNVYHQSLSPSEQKYYARDLLKPIANKLIGICGGNHDEGRTKEDVTPVRDLAEFLGTHYFDTEMSFKIAVGRKKNDKPCVYSGYGIHGYSSGRFASSPALMLERLPVVADADFYFAGHTHLPITFSHVWFRRDLHNGNMTPVQRLFIGCGSFQGRERYPVRLALTPKVMGAPILYLGGEKKDMWCELPRSICA